VIITGGGAGIGRATARRFAREGWRVLITDLSKADGMRTVDELKAAGGAARFVFGNVADEAHSQEAARVAVETWGRIDAFVANAGARVRGSILEATEAEWELILNVNLKGVAYGCKAVLPTMLKQRAGAIVVVSSVGWWLARPTMMLYDATKAAVVSLMRSLAVTHGRDGVRVNAVCPGHTITDFHERAAATKGETPDQLRARLQGTNPLGRPAEPEHIAGPIYFLCSDDAAHITGQPLMIDGGSSAGRG
jgi:meso-butanediol dehydrogenase/(S,S)-butanediol dehydrogenase/diacetyl reductase